MSTYKQLQDRVAAYLFNRTDLTTIIPTLINQAQRKLERENWNCMMEHKYTSASDSALVFPTDYKSVISFKVLNNGTYYDLEHTDLDDLINRYATSQTGVPECYASNHATSEFMFGPAPDTTYDFYLYYYKHLTALSGDSDTNWWTNNAEELLVYGALLESEAYIGTDDRLPVWKAFYDDTYQALRKSEKEEQFAGRPQYLSGDYVV